MSNDVLDRELLVYEQQEPWKADQDIAMICREVEETVALGLFLFERISRLDEECHSKAFSGLGGMNLGEVLTLYRRWHTPCERLLEAVADPERQGFEVEGAKKFR